MPRRNYKARHETKKTPKSYRPSWRDRVGVDLGNEKKSKPNRNKQQITKKKRKQQRMESTAATPNGMISFFCDGSCFPTNPGKVGWSFVNCETGDRGFGGLPHGTNNFAELTGAIKTMEHVLEKRIHLQGKPVVIFCDSQYTVRGAMEWLPKWKKNGWKRNSEGGNNLKNLDLWKRVSELLDLTGVLFRWVKGHNGNHWNEMCDRLAKEGATRQITKYLPGKPVVARTVVVDEDRLIMSSFSVDELIQENTTLLF